MSSENSKDADVIKQAIVDKVAEALVNNLKKALKDRDKVLTGKAEKSIQYYKEIKTVGSELDYIANIEYGRRAGTHVPIKPLMEWVMNKMHVPQSEAYRVAKSVEKKIFEDGIPMTRFAKTTVEEMAFR